LADNSQESQLAEGSENILISSHFRSGPLVAVLLSEEFYAMIFQQRHEIWAALMITMAVADTGCLGRCVAAPTPRLQSGIRIPVVTSAINKVDVLFEIDNSGSMAENQRNLARNFGVLIDQLVNPPVDPATMRRRYEPVNNLHVGVISSDLGTPGYAISSCANSDRGDDGLLNPIRFGGAMRSHLPWANPARPIPAGARPARCGTNPDVYPSFLTFEASATNANEFRDDFICNAYLNSEGCGLEQQLESAYRALVSHNARAMPGNTDPNAGFVRDDAVLAIVMLTDEEDGSVRDCRFAEPGFPCENGTEVYDSQSSAWGSADLNLRFYKYTPGTAQDPTWSIDRYIDPMRPNRGFLSLKPGRPELVIFSAIAGVPITLPMRTTSQGERVDWNALLGTAPNGSDGLVGMSPEGAISMRQNNSNHACTDHVVPACRREGSAPTDSCLASVQYYASPSRRIARVAQRFSELHDNGTISSICKNDYTSALSQIVERIGARTAVRCLPRALETTPPICTSTVTRNCAMPGTSVTVNCTVREILPVGTTAATACRAARGRTPTDRDTTTGRAACLVQQVALPLGGVPPAGQVGFFYDTRTNPSAPDCRQNVRFTEGAEPVPGSTSVIECVQANSIDTSNGNNGNNQCTL
jgi:hypothetical protein